MAGTSAVWSVWAGICEPTQGLSSRPYPIPNGTLTSAVQVPRNVSPSGHPGPGWPRRSSP